MTDVSLALSRLGREVLGYDKNKDGLSQAEIDQLADRNKDGVVSKEERELCEKTLRGT